jgi:2-iminobutanoate/2-iminopropanoate deaminase
VAAPFGPYSHAVEVPEGSRPFYISGEVGVLPDGSVPEGIEAQAEACWRNITAILADAGMGIGDLVKITTYLVRPEDVTAAGAPRAKHFGDARPNTRRGLAPLQRPSKHKRGHFRRGPHSVSLEIVPRFHHVFCDGLAPLFRGRAEHVQGSDRKAHVAHKGAGIGAD